MWSYSIDFKSLEKSYDHIWNTTRGVHHPDGSQVAFLTGLAHLYNLIPYQRRAKHAGLWGVEVEGGRVPTSDWILNLQILTSGGYQYHPEPPHH